MDLLSVLILTYTVSGHSHESEIEMHHAQCMAAQTTLSRAIKGPRQGRPTVELHNGARVPVESASCLMACTVDGLEPLDTLKGDA